MVKGNPYLDKLLKVQKELKDTGARLDALESGIQVTAEKTIVNDRHATFLDFLSKDEMERINRSFSESLNRTVECDGLDYALASACGVMSGFIDILFVKT